MERFMSRKHSRWKRERERETLQESPSPNPRKQKVFTGTQRRGRRGLTANENWGFSWGNENAPELSSTDSDAILGIY